MSDLGRARAGGKNLRDSDLRGANLRDSDLQGADLRDSDLRGANLRDSDLQGADLRDSDLRGADLGGADLWGADLGGSNLRGADLGGADLGGANLRGADLGGVNLHYARGVFGVANLPSGPAYLVPLVTGWTLTIDCWTGTTDELRTLIAGDDAWPEAEGEQITERRPMLAALADMCDAWAAANDHYLAAVQAKWGTK